eukprot:2049204-Prymnesium_polylepis.1
MSTQCTLQCAESSSLLFFYSQDEVYRPAHATHNSTATALLSHRTRHERVKSKVNTLRGRVG